jgi:hypothetical protein
MSMDDWRPSAGTADTFSTSKPELGRQRPLEAVLIVAKVPDANAFRLMVAGRHGVPVGWIGRGALAPASKTSSGHTRHDGPQKPSIGERTVTKDINVLALLKGSERYIFLYNDSRRAETLRTLGRFASNPELSFSWYDAAVLSQKIRQNARPALDLNSRFQLPYST